MRRTLLAALVLACSCGDDAALPSAPVRTGTATAFFVVPASLDELAEDRFFEHPFPSDVRREADGTVRFTGWPNPARNALLGEYIDAARGLLDGFSPATAAYLRFTDAIDPGSLPADPPAAARPDAAVQVIDVDPASPEQGSRHLVQLHWQESVAEGSYWHPNTLAVMPILGRPLRPRTRYAVVVTSKVRAKGGGPVAPSSDLEEVLGVRAASARTAPAHDLFAPAVAELGRRGVPAKDIVHLTVFTTNDPTAEVFAIADDVRTSVPPPTASGWSAKETRPEYDVYEGSYGPSPNYQAGTTPYRKRAEGGGFVFGAGAKPVVQGTFDLRFALAVPNASRCPPPPGGHPIVLYAHGTGGDYRSFLRDDTATALATRCLASIGIDQIFHGTRPGAPEADDPQRESRIQLLFFNFDNPIAGRTNNRQSAIDILQETRLFTESAMRVPASVARTRTEIGFDGGRVLFFGHSQGGLSGPLFLAASNAVRGGVLSGAGSMLAIALLEKTKPIDVSSVVRVLLGLTDDERAKELSKFHPAITVAQAVADTTDPVHYGAFITSSPRPGFAPKSILQTEGVAADGTGDTYSPPHGIEALAVAIGLPRALPGTRPYDEARWSGLADVALPAGGVRGNLGGGSATGALVQFTPPAASDGHFVVFRVPEARGQAATFCADLAADPVGRLLPPTP